MYPVLIFILTITTAFTEPKVTESPASKPQLLQVSTTRASHAAATREDGTHLYVSLESTPSGTAKARNGVTMHLGAAAYPRIRTRVLSPETTGIMFY